MKETLISILETICPNNVFLQGTMNEDESYPDDFITFFTTYTEDRAHYDNDVHSIDWTFSVIFYSNDPDRVQSIPDSIRTALKNAGFVPQGKGIDVTSDNPSHTGWAMDFKITETL